jgi:protein O-mannosyl-transferase
MRRRAPLLMLACVWPIVALLPTNSLLAKIDPVTEMPLYLAWVGPAIAIGYGARLLYARARTPLTARFTAASGTALLCLCAGAWRDCSRSSLNLIPASVTSHIGSWDTRGPPG